MNTLIVSLLLITIFTNNSMCMDNPMPVPIEASSFAKATKIDIRSSTDLLHEFILNTHKYVGILPTKEREFTPARLINQARNFFVPISRVNKKTYAYISRPDIMRTIIGNVSNNYHQDRIAGLFKTWRASRYCTFSACLEQGFEMLKISQIAELIQLGADVNYYPKGNGWKPLLVRAAERCSKKTEILLQAGANPNITYEVFFLTSHTPLSCAITVQNYAAIELFLKHEDIDFKAGNNAAIKAAIESKDERILALLQSVGVFVSII